MNTVIQNWDFLNDSSLALLPPPSTQCPSSSPPPEAAMLSNGVTELTWKNGQLAMQGLDTSKRVSSNKPFSSTTTATTSVTDGSHNWAKPSCNGTLESVVDQAHGRTTVVNDCVPWFMAQYGAIPPVVAAAAAATPTIRVDAMVPCSGSGQNLSSLMLGGTGGGGPCAAAASTRVESCSVGTLDNWNGRNEQAMKRAKLTAAAADYSSRDNSVSGTMDTQQLTIDTCDWDADMQGAFTGNSLGSPGNTSSANKTAADDRDSVGQSRPQRGGGDEKEKKKVLGAKASISTKRSRAAAVHNQSERKRRDKINERMRTLQKLVPHSSKSDKASMLDEVIEYLKQLQAQINMMSRMGMSPMNMNPMMMPLALQQQMQMSMMSQMGMGMGMNPMGMGMMDMNAMGRSNVPGLSPPVLHPNPFMPMQPPQWDMTNAANANDRVLPPAPGPSLAPAPSGPPLVPDPIAASLLAFQSQPLTLEGYSKMAAMFQHMNQIPTSGAKN